MVISNLNIKQIEDRLGFILKATARLKHLAGLSEAEFIQNDFPAVAESYLRRALEAVFDIGRHILAKTAAKGIVEYKEIACMLAKNSLLTQPQSERLTLMAGYRKPFGAFLQ